MSVPGSIHTVVYCNGTTIIDTATKEDGAHAFLLVVGAGITNVEGSVDNGTTWIALTGDNVGTDATRYNVIGWLKVRVTGDGTAVKVS